MTLEEAKKLKPGDRVLVEMEIGFDPNNRTIDKEGDVWFDSRFVNHELIREKLEPTTRRKFRKGDIVSRNGHLYYVAEDEHEDGKVLLNCWDDGVMHTRADLLTLERSVEDRAARKEGV